MLAARGSGEPQQGLCAAEAPAALATPLRGEGRLRRMTASPSLAVVVPAHRAGPDLDRCLDAIAALDPAPDEVVVAVDGADPAVVARAEAAGAVVVPLERRGGPGRARNEGVLRTTADVVLFCDSDVVVHDDAVGVVRDHLAAHPDVAGLFGRYDARPAAPQLLSRTKNLTHRLAHTAAGPEATTFWAGLGALRRDAFAAVGGFDEAYERPCVEDVELGHRLRAAGHRVQVVPALEGTHLKRWTARGLLVTDVRDRAVPWSAMVLREGRVDDDLDVDRRARAQVALAGVALAATAAGLAVAARGDGVRAAGAAQRDRGAPTARPTLARVCGVVSLAAVSGQLVLDAGLLRGLLREGGPGPALVATAWQPLRHTYSGIGFAVALADHAAQRAGLRPPHRPRLRDDLHR